MVTLPEDQYTFSIISPSFLLRIKMFQTKVVEKLKTHVLCSITSFLNRAFYEIRWTNYVEQDRSQKTIWRMRIACWIPKAINTHVSCVILLAFPLQQWLHEAPHCYVLRTLPVLFSHYFTKFLSPSRWTNSASIYDHPRWKLITITLFLYAKSP